MFPILHECLLEDQLQVAKTLRKYKNNILKAAYISEIMSNVMMSLSMRYCLNLQEV